MMSKDALLKRSAAPVPKTWRRWFAFLAGGIAWTLHLLSIYAIGEFGCVSGLGESIYWNISVVAWLILISSVALLVVAMIAASIGFVDMRKDANLSMPIIEDEGGVYLSKFGFILSVLFCLIIIVETLPVFAYLHGC